MRSISKKCRTNLYRASCGSLASNIISVCFILVMMIVTGTNSQAQSNALYIQGSGGSVTVSGYDGINPTLFVSGEIKLAGSGATLSNSSGYVQVTGNVTNSGGVITSNGTDNFSGGGTQVFSGTLSGTSYFGNVIKSNTGNVTLNNNTDFYSLTFSTDGTIDVSSGTTVSIKNPAYTAITGYTSARYVDVGNSSIGFLKRKINDVTSGNYYAFPLGNSTAGYKRIDINYSSLGATGVNDVTGTLKNGSPGSLAFSKTYPSGFSGTTGGSCTIGAHKQLVEFSCLKNDYWSFSGPSTYDYVVQVFTSGCGSRPNRVITSTPGGGTWTADIENTVDAVTDDMCEFTDWSNGVATTVPGGRYRGMTKDFALGGGSTAALPVTLINFDAQAKDNQYIQTLWMTASEISNKGFYLMRSTDALAWEKLTFIPSKADGGNSTGTLSYFYDDHAVSSNKVYYYQLIQEDLDGKQTATDIVSASISNSKISSIVFYPNPSSGMVTLGITLKEESSPVTIRVTNTVGQLVYSEDLVVSENTFKKMIQLPESGQYQIQVTTSDEVFTEKVIILTK